MTSRLIVKREITEHKAGMPSAEKEKSNPLKPKNRMNTDTVKERKRPRSISNSGEVKSPSKVLPSKPENSGQRRISQMVAQKDGVLFIPDLSNEK